MAFITALPKRWPSNNFRSQKRFVQLPAQTFELSSGEFRRTALNSCPSRTVLFQPIIGQLLRISGCRFVIAWAIVGIEAVIHVGEDDDF